MAPSTRRSLRQKRQKLAQEHIETGDAEFSLSDTSRGTNSRGLPVFPDELLLEVLSYFPPVPLSHLSDHLDSVTRRDTLHALTRTCSNLRRFFHPYVWERIEVCSGMLVGRPPRKLGPNVDHETRKAYATELVRQLEIVTIRDPSLAQHVKILNVEITDFSIKNVFAELARCVALFSNLHSVAIRKDAKGSQNDVAARRAFGKCYYPQITRLILSKCAFPLLDACPNTISFQSLDIWNTEDVLPSLRTAPRLQQLYCSFPPLGLDAIAARFPLLKALSICITPIGLFIIPHMFVAAVTELSFFKNLDVLIIEVREPIPIRGAKMFAEQVFLFMDLIKAEKPKRIVVRVHNLNNTAQMSEATVVPA